MKKILFALLLLSNQQFPQKLDTLNQNTTTRTEIVFYEVGAGVIATVVSFLPSALLVKAMSNPEGLGEAFGAVAVTTLISLTLGGSLGVHLVDNEYNKNSSYLLALGGSLVGLGIGYGLLNAFESKEGYELGGPEILTTLFSPLVFSILSVNLINFENLENNLSINYQPEIMFNNLSHKINIRINL